jgi:hypothetical protein
VIPEVILPPLGAVAMIEGEPVAMAWVHVANYVAFVGHSVAMPGLALPEVSQGLILLGDLIKEHCSRLGVKVILMTAPPAIARYAIRYSGFKAYEQPMINMACNLEEA